MNYIVSTVGFVLAGSAAPSLMSWQWAGYGWVCPRLHRRHHDCQKVTVFTPTFGAVRPL